MCVVSMIGDHYSNKWGNPLPGINIQPDVLADKEILKQLAELKKEVLEMKELLKLAIEYDKRTNQLDCENEEKIKVLKDVANLVGVSLDDVFKGQK